jgi:hypothetical protein
LEYTIRFQNTGTDTAFTIVIRDTLDINLDLSTFKTMATSHEAGFQMEGNKYAIWTFNNILLPDSGVNEQASHGYVKFSILPKTGVPDQTLILNRAAIYFDFNEPVITNTAVVKVDFASGVHERTLAANEINIFPNPSQGIFIFELSKNIEHCKINIYDMVGNLLLKIEDFIDKREVDLSSFPEGIYIYKIAHLSGVISTGKMVVMK